MTEPVSRPAASNTVTQAATPSTGASQQRAVTQLDPFTRLGFPPRFALDLRGLEARQRELGRALHPDRYVGSPASERRRSLGEAMDVNRAYREVRDPVSRALALLKLLGVPASELDNSGRADHAFLMDVLEQREALSEARAQGDKAQVQVLAAQMLRKQQDLEAQLTGLFDSGALAEALDAAVASAPAPASVAVPETLRSAPGEASKYGEAVTYGAAGFSGAAVSSGAAGSPHELRVSHPQFWSQVLNAVSQLRYVQRFLDEVAVIEDETG